MSHHNLTEQMLEMWKEPVNVAILMSGAGSNAEAILKHRNDYPSVKFCAVCTDKETSRAKEIAARYGLEYRLVKGSVKNPDLREAYFEALADVLDDLRVESLIYAGFMKVSPPNFLKRFPGINVHPADLSLVDGNGKPRYVGMYGVADALKAGENYVASTVHIVDAEVDCGQPLVISHHLKVDPASDPDPEKIHDRLKHRCEHVVFPFTLQQMAEGNLEVSALPLHMEKVTGPLQEAYQQFRVKTWSPVR